MFLNKFKDAISTFSKTIGIVSISMILEFQFDHNFATVKFNEMLMLGSLHSDYLRVKKTRKSVNFQKIIQKMFEINTETRSWNKILHLPSLSLSPNTK